MRCGERRVEELALFSVLAPGRRQQTWPKKHTIHAVGARSISSKYQGQSIPHVDAHVRRVASVVVVLVFDVDGVQSFGIVDVQPFVLSACSVL